MGRQELLPPQSRCDRLTRRFIPFWLSAHFHHFISTRLPIHPSSGIDFQHLRVNWHQFFAPWNTCIFFSLTNSQIEVSLSRLVTSYVTCWFIRPKIFRTSRVKKQTNGSSIVLIICWQNRAERQGVETIGWFGCRGRRTRQPRPFGSRPNHVFILLNNSVFSDCCLHTAKRRTMAKGGNVLLLLRVIL